MATSLPNILLTGFDPFGGESINPSWEAVRALHGRRIGGHRVVARLLPTEFAASLRLLKAAVRETAPAILLGVGQAGGRERLSIERVAVNLQDARIPDNAGARPIDQPVIPGGPAAYFSNLPVKAMLAALRDRGVPAELSHTAGTYVCNHVAYAMLHLAAKRRGARAGFIHIPYLPAQAARLHGKPSMALEEMVHGLEIALRVAATTRTDLTVSGGAID
ncbi:pyroglutamyl-peptidase I [Rhodanobacter sp. PCA2]|uniref:pyroglutamyl-peptidase I n=1 Tax=Rhodanobacter sp. PCA2 TaxID=2006117 RepID=UPI001C63567B|nr:pyroglutamyl-peptidase I [Rhodanobacter sp. PCA2]MBA2078146.1 pyroglutamyl-peptidase I [Rhodanobacter sp. PCA2]